MNTSIDGAVNNYNLSEIEEDSDFTISLVAINPAGRSEAAIENTRTLRSGAHRELGLLIDVYSYWPFMFFM